MSRANRLLVAAVAALAGVLLPLGFAYPHLMIEDSPVETAAAAGFAITSLVALGLLATGLGPMPRQALWLGSLLAFSLLLFLSEVSFGARLFDLRMPAMPGGGEFDGGHDAVILLYRVIRDAGPAAWAMAAAAAALACVAITATLLRGRPAPMLRHVAGDARAFGVTTMLALLAAAVLLDLVEGTAVAIVEETLELLASGVMLWTTLGFLQLPVSPALRSAARMGPAMIDRTMIRPMASRADAPTLPSRR